MLQENKGTKSYKIYLPISWQFAQTNVVKNQMIGAQSKTKRRKAAMGLLIIYLVSTLMVGCMSSDGYSTKIKLEGGETPIFTVSGSGLLGNFKIYGPRQRSGEDGRAFTVWEIQPVKGHLEGESLEKIGSIKYGIVPNGYKQIYPEDGSMPPPIVPGVRYIYWAQTVNAPEAREAFELIGGKATVVPGNK